MFPLNFMQAWKQPFIKILILTLESNTKDTKFHPFCLHFINWKVKILVKMKEIPARIHAGRCEVCPVI